MKKRLWLITAYLFIVGTLLVGCGPSKEQAATQTAIEATATFEALPIATHTPTFTHTPTITPTSTPTSIPTLEGLSIPVPDPRITNPELFDLKSTDAPVPQFVNAMKMAGIEITAEQVSQGITFEKLIDVNGNPFVVAIYIFDPDPAKQKETLEGVIPFAIAGQNENGEWEWQESTLRELAKSLNIEIGTIITSVVNVSGLSNAELNTIRSKQFNLGLISLYWPNMERQQGSIDANSRINAADFASSNNMDSIGHLVLWGKDVPTWLKEGNFSRDQMIDILKTRVINTIKTMAHYGVYSYIVVNEASSGDDIFKQKIGKDYVNIAFITARDTGNELGIPLTLIYNDYSNHTPNGQRTQKTIEIVNQLRQQGLIDAVGLEMILSYPENPSVNEIISTMQSYDIPVIITEGAVLMGNFKGDPIEKFKTQAQIYNNIFTAALRSGVCSKFIVFVPVDEMSPWETEPTLEGYSPNNDPSLYSLVNGDIMPKPSFYTIMEVLMEQILSSGY